MNYKIPFAFGLGTPEIILILISALFFFTFLGVIIFLIHSAMKRRDNKLPPFLPPNVAINFTAPAVVANDNNKDHLTSVPRNTPSEKIALPQQHEIRYVSISEIVRCEADDNYTNIYLSHGEKVLISKSLKEYSDLLVPQGFLRTHQSHLVNPSFVKSWLKEDGGVLLMNKGDKVPVSKPNRESVKVILGTTSKFTS